MFKEVRIGYVFKGMLFLRVFVCVLFLSNQLVWAQASESVKFDFNSLEGWRDDSATGSPKSYQIKNGNLVMSTRANSKDRVKVATDRRYGLGVYQWRVYVPRLGVGDQASIGAFLYRDDKHEVDFEIGYGTKKLRAKLKAKADELVCYCTSQGHPYSSTQLVLKRERWYNLGIDLRKSKEGKYTIIWTIDGKEVKKLPTKIAADISFTVHCSVENLTFLGDHLPKITPWAKFDYFEFKAVTDKK